MFWNIIFMKYPQINITEQVQFTFKVDIHYIWLYPIQVDITKQKHINIYIYVYIYIYIYTYVPIKALGIFTTKVFAQIISFDSNFPFPSFGTFALD